MNASDAHQVSDAPGHHQIKRQSQFKLGDAVELQRLDAAAVLEHVKQRLDFPSAAVPSRSRQPPTQDWVRGGCSAMSSTGLTPAGASTSRAITQVTPAVPGRSTVRTQSC